jgi:Ca-activated chloride channel family protein
MLTPLVIAMPRKMADALGYPAKPVGFKDIVALAKDPAGWAKFGHPEWGAFRLGKTNPNLSTSGLNFTIAEHYAATGTSRDLSAEELDRPDVNQFVTDVESSVVHYGDTTLTFLNNWYRADARGTALTYTSAVAVEEKSVIDYNSGNPDGELSPGETPRPPREPLVAIYPSEGTLFSDSPFVIVDAPWVSPVQKQGAELFRTFVLLPDNQRKVLQSGFRPGNTQVPLATPIIAANGVDPTQPQAVLDVPKPDVLVKILDKWATQRKTARVMLVMDVSGSMGDEANPTTKETKLDLAKRAAISALDQFKDDDEVGLRIFSTGLDRNDANVQWLDLLPVSPIGAQREGLRNKIRDLVPVHGTPLYDVTASAYTAMTDGFDAKKINAVVLLTDGKNEDGTKSDDAAQLSGLLQELQVGSEGADTRPVRIFPIAYGKDADMVTLRQIAEATAGAVYDASNPNTIEQVFTAVVSNF